MTTDEQADGSSHRSQQQTKAEEARMQNINLFLDIELEASLRFGARELPLREVLDLGPGDVVELTAISAIRWTCWWATRSWPAAKWCW